MTPEDLISSKPLRTVPAFPGAEILFYERGDALLRMRNERNAYEVLATSDRAPALMDDLHRNVPMTLTGFWRRRSGFHPDGRRHFIWTLVLISWEAHETAALAA